MEVKISDKDQYEKNVEVTVPYEDLAPKLDEAYKSYKKSIQLGGFRKGKVPIDLIKKVFGQKIEREVAEDAVSHYLQKAVAENKIRLHDVVQIESLDFDKEKGLNFKAVIRIEPDITLKKYKGVEVEKEVYKVTDEDINETLENLRQQHATMATIEGEAKDGNYIVADVQKTDATGLPLIGEKYENRYFLIGDENSEQSFTDQIIGVKAGDVRRVTIPVKDKTEGDEDQHYSFTIKEVLAKNLPELDDEFAKDLGQYENLDALKAAIKESLEKQTAANYKQKFYDHLMDEIIKNNPIDLPEFMIEDFLSAFIENMKNENRDKVDEQEIRDRYRADAIWNIKWMLIRDKISELEDIKVDDADVDRHIAELAKNAGKEAAKISAAYNEPKKREQLKRELLENKILEFLESHANIKEKEVTYQDLKKAKELIQND